MAQETWVQSPGWVIPKTQKMVLDSSLLNTQHCKVRIKGKVEQSRERSNALAFFESLVWPDLGLNPGLPGHWQTHTHKRVCVYIYMCVCECIYIYIYIYTHVCVYTCVNICLCLYIYIYIYIYMLHFFIDTYLIEHNRLFLFTYFL